MVHLDEIHLDGYIPLYVDVGGCNFSFGCRTHDIFEDSCNYVYGSIVFVVCGLGGVL